MPLRTAEEIFESKRAEKQTQLNKLRQDKADQAKTLNELDQKDIPDTKKTAGQLVREFWQKSVKTFYPDKALAIVPGEKLRTIVPTPPDKPEFLVPPQSPTKSETKLSPEEELDKELERVASNVVKLSVHTKFPAGAKIAWKGEEILIDKLIHWSDRAGNKGASGDSTAQIDQGEVPLPHDTQEYLQIGNLYNSNHDKKQELLQTLFFSISELELTGPHFEDSAFAAYKDKTEKCMAINLYGMQSQNIFAGGRSRDNRTSHFGSALAFTFVFKNTSALKDFFQVVFKKPTNLVPVRLQKFLDKAYPHLIVIDHGQLEAEELPPDKLTDKLGTEYKRDDQGFIIVKDENGQRVEPGITMKPITKLIMMNPTFSISKQERWYTQSDPTKIWKTETNNS